MRLGKGPIAFPHCLIMSTIGCTDSGYEDYAYNSLQSAHTSVFRLAVLGLVVFRTHCFISCYLFEPGRPVQLPRAPT